MGWREKVDRARKLHRPDLKNWQCDGLHETFPSYARSVAERENYESYLPFGNGSIGTTAGSNNNAATIDTIPAILDARSTSPDSFQREYEARCVPSVIRGIPEGYDLQHSTTEAAMTSGKKKKERGEWPALRRWGDLDRLEADGAIRDRMFKVGEDDDGKSLKLKMKHFTRYLRSTKDDSPLYIFDSSFDEDKDAKRLLDDYRVPSYFDEDLFHLVGERRRPPYRWFLVGPERSGTTVHIDPLGTSAWNTLILGRKRWVLFPPHVPKHIAKGRGLVKRDEDDEAVHYFMTILPRIKRRAAESGGTGEYEHFACYEFTQNVGETVFIPHGWWHAVLNLSDSVGVTQNYCSERNFDVVWRKTRTGRKKMAYKWLCQLDAHYPRLAERARKMNEVDGFVMRYDPVEVKRRKREEERRKRAKREARAATKEKKKRKAKREKKRQKISKGTAVGRRDEDGILTTSHSTLTETLDRESKRSRIESRAISPDTV